MSDGMTDGYRAAREHKERQGAVDAFFSMIETYARGSKPDEDAFREAHARFDTIRFADHIARYRLEDERAMRWKAFRSSARRTLGLKQTLDDPTVRSNWAWVIAMAMRYASPDAAKSLQEASPYRRYRVALFIPSGKGGYGQGRGPTLLGDFAEALDLLMRADGKALVIRLHDKERAVIGLRKRGDHEEETLDPERAELRFIAVPEKTGKK